MKDLIEASEDGFFVVLGNLPLGDLPFSQTTSQSAAATSSSVSTATSGSGSTVQSSGSGDRPGSESGGHRTDGQSHFGNGVLVTGGGGLNDGSGSSGRSGSGRSGTRSVGGLRNRLRAQVDFGSGSVDTTIGASVEATQSKVRAIGVALTRRPAVGDDSCAFGVGQGVHVGTVSVSIAVVVTSSSITESVLGQTVVRLGSGAINVVPVA